MAWGMVVHAYGYWSSILTVDHVQTCPYCPVHPLPGYTCRETSSQADPGCQSPLPDMLVTTHVSPRLTQGLTFQSIIVHEGLWLMMLIAPFQWVIRIMIELPVASLVAGPAITGMGMKQWIGFVPINHRARIANLFPYEWTASSPGNKIIALIGRIFSIIIKIYGMYEYQAIILFWGD